MSEKYKANDDLPYFVTMTFQGWVDLFTREVLKCLKTDNSESRREWVLRLFKYYAKYLKQNKDYAVWRKSNRPIVLDNPELYDRCLDYIHFNPVKAGLVLEPIHWLYSSACNENPINEILRIQYGEGA